MFIIGCVCRIHLFSEASSVSLHVVQCLTVIIPVCNPGPPSPPDSVTVEEVTDSTAQLAWNPGRDNGSPIAIYLIQTRNLFTVGWQRVNTGSHHLQIHFHLKADVILFRPFSKPHRNQFPLSFWQSRSMLGQRQSKKLKGC